MSIFTKSKLRLSLGLLLATQGFDAWAQGPFTCQDQVSYYTRNAATSAASLPYTLYSTNLISGTPTALGAVNVGGTNVPVNAIGYNTVDNYIWGSQPGTANILRIGNNGAATSYPVTGLPTATAALTFASGDVDAAGNLYLYASGTTVYKINLAVTPHVATPITLNTGSNLTDFSVSADGTKLYGISAGNGVLVTYTITGATATFATRNVGSSAFNSNTFLDSRGNLFFQSLSSGSIYLLNPTSTIGNVEIVTTGTGAINNSDGAQCPNASVYTNTQPVFGCKPGVGYTIDESSGEIREINLTNNSTAVIGDVIDSPSMVLNNLGYNPKDDYLWAARSGTNMLVRIGSDFTIQHFQIPGLPVNASYNAGEFDKNGIFYLMNGNTSSGAKTIHKVDLNPSSSSYGTYLGSITTSISLSALTDMTVNPVDGFLYGVTNGRSLVKIDPATGATTNLGATGIPGSDNIVVAFADNTGAVYVQGSSSTTIYKIANTQGGNTTAAVFKTGVPATGGGDGARCSVSPFDGVTVSGSVWNDGNGNRVKEGSEGNTLPAGETLTVYVVDASGNIIGKADVGSDGSWSVPLIPPGTHTFVLSNDPSLDYGDVGTSIATTLPTDWVNTGTSFGTPGAVGSASGPLTVASTPIINTNFGIQKIPIVSPGTDISRENPGGTTQSPVSASVFGGSDQEDGTYPDNLLGRTVDLIPGTGGSLYYNAVQVQASGTSVSNFDPTKVGVDPDGTINSDPATVSFTYAVTDNAGFKSNLQPIQVGFVAGPLPVTLTSFVAKNIGGTAARLAWSTTYETNSDRFEIQRSSNAEDWVLIGTQASAGESKGNRDYNFTDNSPLAGLNYYRLQMLDKDGTSTYSRIESVEFGRSALKLTLYPNPVSKTLFVQYNDGKPVATEHVKQVLITQSNGIVVYKSAAHLAVSSQGIDVQGLPSGLYLIKVTLNDGTVTSSKVQIK